MLGLALIVQRKMYEFTYGYKSLISLIFFLKISVPMSLIGLSFSSLVSPQKRKKNEVHRSAAVFNETL